MDTTFSALFSASASAVDGSAGGGHGAVPVTSPIPHFDLYMPGAFDTISGPRPL